MPWNTDDDIPIEKPKEIIELELMGQDERDSMPPREIDGKLRESANALAKSYKKLPNANFSECVATVSVALNQTGSSIGGEFGKVMLSRSKSEASRACRIVFED